MAAVVSRRAFLRGATGVIGAGAVTALVGCAQGTPDPVPSDDDVKAAVTVRVADNVYEPAEVEIAAGLAVRWVFEGREQHDVVADDGSFVSELMSEGSYTHLFTDAGDFDYTCSIHPEMRGIVQVVEPA